MYVFAQNCSLLRSNCRGVEDAAPYDETHRFPPIKAFCYNAFLPVLYGAYPRISACR